VNGFPSAIKFEQPPPEDLDGTYDGSDELFQSGLPKIYLFPSEKKQPPYLVYVGKPKAEHIV
jgi:hypothetical protein